MRRGREERSDPTHPTLDTGEVGVFDRPSSDGSLLRRRIEAYFLDVHSLRVQAERHTCATVYISIVLVHDCQVKSRNG